MGSSEPPEWFVAALAREPELGVVEVDGAGIHYRSWGEPGRRNIVLVHGGAAHSRWWDHIAPLLATEGRVIAIDLSGHGDSDHRDTYSLTQWGAEVLATAADAGLGPSPIVVGHSMGGLVTLKLVTRAAGDITRAIIIDSPFGGAIERIPESPEIVAGRRRLYATKSDAVARFRPVPRQDSLPWVREHIAETSVREVDGGWTWKFDDRIFRSDIEIPTRMPADGTRLAFFRAEYGLVLSIVRDIVLSAGSTFVEIPEAGHAPMLDQPIALVTGIRSILAGWDSY